MPNWSDFQRKHIQPIDFGKVPVDGDPDFDAEHNKRVIAETEKKSDRIQREKQREFDEALKERAYAAGKMVEHIKSGGDPNTQKYFGKKYIEYLRGQHLVDKYKMIWTDAQKKKQAVNEFKSKIESLKKV